ncbi:hypothetical protein RSSM_05498 [Rhodopirellula sallentina SM41]|uniref:Uncharacterized protein n=1 Tax=Rhodopirellula sallentina SM41 TaxID=1263870 RepID=M5TV65_9BACT|nr:hypothetical protein RSSM_05498 [Rhodopirellula sallentina SM41]
MQAVTRAPVCAREIVVFGKMGTPQRPGDFNAMEKFECNGVK